MADTTDVLAIPFPEGGDSFAASAVQSLAERVDEVPGIESLTSAQIAALGAALKPAGRVVYNSTTGKLQVSNGTSFVDVDAAAKTYTDQAMPIGSIIAYGGTTAPTGWHLCNGTAHGSATLQTLIGSANTPDLRDRFIVGVSGTKARGATGGAETHTLTEAEMPSHSHSVTDPGHSHGLYQPSGSGTAIPVTVSLAAQTPSFAGTTTNATGITLGDAGSDQPHNNMPPYYALVYIIKTI